MEKIDKLRNDLNIVNKKRATIQNQIEKIEQDEELPKLREQFEGKFFVYDNGTSRETRWKLYVRCLKVTNLNEAIIDSFESTPYENQFKHKSKEHHFLFQTEIKSEEYFKELNKFKKKLQSL